MNIRKFITRLLKLKGLKVRSFYFADYNRELHLEVAPYKNGCRCPICGRRCRIHKVAQESRIWQDIVVCGIKIYFHYRPKEIDCPTDSRRQEIIPWASDHSRITYRLEFLILKYAQTMTQANAAELLKIPKSTFAGLLHQIIGRARKDHKIRGLKSVGVDEISYARNKKYATIVYDLESSCVVWAAKGKGRNTIDDFFRNHLSEYQRKNITTASCDMSETYINAIKEHCPNGILVLDKFHIVKALNEALDTVRKEEWHSLGKSERKALKGLRWLLYKHSGNRTKRETRLINSLKKGNRHIHRAWVLKDEFELFWEYKSPAAARKFLKRWLTTALKSRIESFKKFVGTIRRHFENIVAYIGNAITNAKAEGINRIIKQIKDRSSGFKVLDNFINMIYLTIGDMDIPAQIPAKFRI
jgi:transposase